MSPQVLLPALPALLDNLHPGLQSIGVGVVALGSRIDIRDGVRLRETAPIIEAKRGDVAVLAADPFALLVGSKDLVFGHEVELLIAGSGPRYAVSSTAAENVNPSNAAGNWGDPYDLRRAGLKNWPLLTKIRASADVTLGRDLSLALRCRRLTQRPASTNARLDETIRGAGRGVALTA
jgi:hypothetical protein